MKLDEAVRALVREVIRDELAAVHHAVPTDESVDVPETQYIDDRELAKRTSISRVTWQIWRARGAGPTHYRVGRRCLYKWHEVVAWIEGRRIEADKSSMGGGHTRGA